MDEGGDHEIGAQLQDAGLLVDGQRPRHDLSGVVSGRDLPVPSLFPGTAQTACRRNPGNFLALSDFHTHRYLVGVFGVLLRFTRTIGR